MCILKIDHEVKGLSMERELRRTYDWTKRYLNIFIDEIISFFLLLNGTNYFASRTFNSNASVYYTKKKLHFN